MEADSRFEQVRVAIAQIGPADHVCTLYDDSEEEVAIAVSYNRAGLDRGELCVCVVDDGGESFLAALAAEGTIRKMIIVHPLVVIHGRICSNPYYVAPEQYLSPDWPRHETDWMMKNRELLQQSQDSLRESQGRYRSLSRRLIEQQEHERGALARELHEQLGQSLVAINLNLQAIKGELSPASRARVPESLQMIKKRIEQVQTLAFELRPSMLDEFGLVVALRSLVTRQGERAGVCATFTAAPTGARAPAGIEIACFRIVQDALSNIARHARATLN